MLKLRLLTGPRAGRQLRVSDTKPVSIGRRKGRLRLHDSRVSKNHAEIYFANDMWVLRDLGSANGTYVNRKRVSGLVELEPGDLVQMGRVLFKIVRCDGIGMDTQPALPDELPGDEEVRLDDVSAQADAAEGDLDLDALFGESDSDDANDDSDIFAATDEPAAEEAPSAVVPEQDKPAPKLVDAAFDQPADDDDSFFADLGEATDTTGGVDVTVNEALADDAETQAAEQRSGEDGPFVLDDAGADAGEQGDPAEASDPFLSGDEQDELSETGDLISLEDESGMGPRNSGTTLLTAVPHDDLINDECESSGSAIIDAAKAPPTQTPETAEYIDDDQEDVEDDQPPALVGLHLDQTPPQQPEAIEEDQADPDVQAEALLDDENEVPPPASDERAEEVAVTDELVDQDLEDLTAEPGAFEETDEAVFEVADADESDAGFDISDALTDDDVEPALEDVLGDLGELDELPDPADALLASRLVETPDEGEDEPAGVAADVLEMDEVDAGLVEDEAVQDPLGTLADELAAEDVPDDEPEPLVAEAAEEELPEGAPVFDIDAAFDALSEGLDDSFVVPAIGADEEPTQPDPSLADPLAGSQLDVGYIKDALSKLEQQQSESTDGRADTSAKATASPTMPPGSKTGDSYLQSPPPGLNPSSLKPPQETGESYRRPGNAGRWFFTLLLLLTIGGAGVWYITEHYDIQITGRDETGPAPANASTPLPGPADNPAVRVPPVGSASQDNAPPPTDETIEPGPQGPNPFATGPVVLGQDALEGITRVTNPSPTDRAPVPTTGTSDTSAPGPPATAEPTRPPLIEPDPVDVPGVAQTPAEPKPPARIVFLVDASGSLVDSLPQMLVWLNRAVQTIESDERFAIYFFKSGEPISIKPEGMIAPSRELLNRISEDWLSADRLPVFPSGRSNPTQAIAKAIALNPTDIYFLSDDAFAFKQGDSNAQQAIDLVKAALGQNDVRVHGVQFFYRSDDSVLETLANDTKGTFEFVRERVVPNADPIDLLEELGGE